MLGGFNTDPSTPLDSQIEPLKQLGKEVGVQSNHLYAATSTPLR